MPSATAILALNVSAIQALTRGAVVRSDTVPPGTADGYTGDFWINTTNYVLYGPKNTTTYWQTSASLIGASGSLDQTNYTQVSSFFFNPGAGYFTCSALSIYSSTQTALLVSAVNTQTGLVVDSNNSTIANFTYSGAPLLTVNTTQITLSSGAVGITCPAVFTKSISATTPLSSQIIFTNYMTLCGGKMLFGDSSIVPFSALQLVPWEMAFAKSAILFDTVAFSVGSGSNYSILGAQGRKLAVNMPYTSVSAISTFAAEFTVAGSTSASGYAALSSLKMPAVTGAGAPSVANFPENHFGMYWNTGTSLLSAVFNINGNIRSVLFS